MRMFWQKKKRPQGCVELGLVCPCEPLTTEMAACLIPPGMSISEIPLGQWRLWSIRYSPTGEIIVPRLSPDQLLQLIVSLNCLAIIPATPGTVKELAKFLGR